MESQFNNGKSIHNNGKTIWLWKNNLIMEKRFDYGKTIWLWKNNSIIEKQFNNGTKFDYGTKFD